VLLNALIRRHWWTILVVPVVVSAAVVVGLILAVPDDCESKYNQLRVGMTEAEVNSVMARRNPLRHLLNRGQRLRRAIGITSVWTEEWYQDDLELVGVHFEWDEDGRLARKAIWKEGRWME
jgi:hypothetical protein